MTLVKILVAILPSFFSFLVMATSSWLVCACGAASGTRVDAGTPTPAADGGGKLDGSPASSSDSAVDASDSSTGTPTRFVPKPGTTWHWQLTGTLDTHVDAAMFDVDLVETSQAQIDALHAKGRVVICYFSAGSREEYRPDANELQGADVGKTLDGWPDEKWLDIRSSSVRNVMKKRLDLAVSKRCDGVEPDNVDVSSNDSGFALTQADGLDYLEFLSREAHARDLSVGLKNALEHIPDVVDDFDWALNEECLSYDECDALRPFIMANKAVFHTEYVDEESEGAARLTTVCAEPSRKDFSTLIKTWDLDAWFRVCP